jgi:hypothetical protein
MGWSQASRPLVINLPGRGGYGVLTGGGLALAHLSRRSNLQPWRQSRLLSDSRRTSRHSKNRLPCGFCAQRRVDRMRYNSLNSTTGPRPIESSDMPQKCSAKTEITGAHSTHSWVSFVLLPSTGILSTSSPSWTKCWQTNHFSSPTAVFECSA